MSVRPSARPSSTGPALVALLSLSVVTAAPASAQEWSEEELAVAAVTPLPTDLRAGAGILVERPDGAFERIRPSANGMSCVWRIPPVVEGRPFFDARCYADAFMTAVLHRWTLDPVPESFAEAHARMEEAIAAGVVVLPETPTAGYRVFGPLEEYAPGSAEVGGGLQKWQSIHFPYRTSVEMGLTETSEASEADLPGRMPYVMASGTWWSHVMIVHEPWPWN